MTYVRRTTREDTLTIVGMVKDYFREMGFEKHSGIPIDEDFLFSLVRHFQTAKDRIVLLSENDHHEVVGIAAAMLSPWPVNQEILAMQEFICWGGGTDELRAEMDVWGRSRGAVCAMISCFLTTPEARMRRIDGD